MLDTSWLGLLTWLIPLTATAKKDASFEICQVGGRFQIAFSENWPHRMPLTSASATSLLVTSLLALPLNSKSWSPPFGYIRLDTLLRKFLTIFNWDISHFSRNLSEVHAQARDPLWQGKGALYGKPTCGACMINLIMTMVNTSPARLQPLLYSRRLPLWDEAVEIARDEMRHLGIDGGEETPEHREEHGRVSGWSAGQRGHRAQVKPRPRAMQWAQCAEKG